MLSGRRIVLGVSGGVAAYKAAYLARRLVEVGATVRSVMTESAVHFLGAQTLAAVTGHHPVGGFWDEAEVSPHTDLGQWADAMVIAPATAATMAKLATGLSDNVLIATALATEAPLVVAPAMHTEMWENPATQRNVRTLLDDGVTIVGPLSGALAGGDSGPGRMVEPEDILTALTEVLSGSSTEASVRDMDGYAVLVTAGGTREPIDPVRYIGNRSSGKMGNAIAGEAARRGAQVSLITTAAPPSGAAIEVVRVETAQQMADATWERAGEVDFAVMAAAVADFRPRQAEDIKLRRGDGLPVIDVEPTPDILAGIAAMENRPYLVGFAAETGSMEGALRKATEKGVDLLVGNDVTRAGSGFATDTNEVTVYAPSGESDRWPLLSKREVARRLWDRILEDRKPG
ncbi:MAG: bifunctional phosphopantothenoylcysteine decarboxylase/phosphopantothenate--cysteine ligase CoaBC [Acidimicrobiia bacterium]|nr:bifunctional phosphopantothenoylcysteine decarboxylase/phosphopantothenate--cysteine ligase CoaBC [Acidimicrobiia bacterium]